jgi:beta-glucosidase-like glycosyl hydrolase
MTAGRLLIPALYWREETGFGHEEQAIGAALGFGAGGFVLVGGNADAVFELTLRLRREAGRPLLIAAELERGPGQQVAGLDELPPPLALASLGDPAVLRGAGLLTAIEALSVGINWILAPVADLDVEPENPVVQTRAFGEDPAQVSAATAAWIIGCEAAGALACAKHFPGHGRVRGDSHGIVPIVSADAELLRTTDLEPFRAAVARGVGSIMTAHVAYPALDPSGAPASFSAPILRILRDELGYGGLIVSDTLMTAGARAGRTPEAAALVALRAGVDLLLCTTDPTGIAMALEREAASDPALAGRVASALQRYAAALQAAPADAFPERLPPAGSSMAAADWLLSAPLLRGEAPRLEQPLELGVIDDDQGSAWVHDALTARGVSLGSGGSRVILALAEPSAAKGRAGFSPESSAWLAREAPGAALVVLFAHPRLLAAVPGDAPVLLGWHRQRLMQEAVARWIARRLQGVTSEQ